MTTVKKDQNKFQNQKVEQTNPKNGGGEPINTLSRMLWAALNTETPKSKKVKNRQAITKYERNSSFINENEKKQTREILKVNTQNIKFSLSFSQDIRDIQSKCENFLRIDTRAN